MRDFHGMSNTRLYSVWKDMIRRCTNPVRADYAHYGAKGILVCDEWLDFRVFAAWALLNGYEVGLSIERVDVNEGYTPSNCKWIPQLEQPGNRSNSRYVTYFGETKYLAEWARDSRSVVSYKRLLKRLAAGWSFEDALTTQVGETRGT